MAQTYGGNLYQLISPAWLPNNAEVKVNGPYDTYGKVLKSEKVERDGKTVYLNLIRGTGSIHSGTVRYSF